MVYDAFQTFGKMSGQKYRTAAITFYPTLVHLLKRIQKFFFNVLLQNLLQLERFEI